MFKIIVTIITFGIGGHTIQVPLDKYPKPFPSYEACMEVIKSDDLNAELARIGRELAADGRNNLIAAKCEPVLDGNGNPTPPLPEGPKQPPGLPPTFPAYPSDFRG
jgi:hypothetical protein